MKYFISYILVLQSLTLKSQQISEEVRSIYDFTSAERFMNVWDSLESSGDGIFLNAVQEWLPPAEYFFKESRNSPDTTLSFRMMYPMAYIYHTLARFDECIPLFVKVLEQENKISRRWNQIALLKLEEAYRRTGNLKEAIPIRQERIEKGFATNFWEIYVDAKLYEEAIKDFVSTEKEPIQGWNRMVHYMKLASLYQSSEDYDTAIYFYQKSYEDGVYICTRDSYDGLGNYAEANKFYWTTYCQGMIGQIKVKQNKFDEAIPLLKEDIRVSKTVNEVDNTIIKRLDLAECYLNLNQLDVAKQYIDTVKHLLKGRGWINMKLRTLEVESDYFMLAKEYEMAAKYLKKFNNLDDSLKAIARKNNIITVTALLDSDKQRALLAEQELEIEQADLDRATQKNRIYLLIAGIIVLTLILLILYSNYRRKMQNKYAAEQKLHEKTVFLKELHHRVKNNLQVTSGLLQLQADKSENVLVNTILNDSKSRVKSMALIHNLLMGDESSKDVSFKAYVEELIDLIESGFSGNQVIKVDTEIIDMKVNVEYAVPLGLIINEILTNSYKYAFDGEEGKISIRFSKEENGAGTLEIRDNGKGFPDDFSIEKNGSLGMELIEMLCDQIRAKFNIFSNKGAVYQIHLNPNFSA
ncbi:MAG: histidine kinase dimerization/phosphoacceptor domain -containing protein [Ekhidna sp.]